MSPRVTAPTFEHHRDALGITETRPRISWTVTSAPQGWSQHGYEIHAVIDGHSHVAPVDSIDSTLVAWPFDPLASGQRATVRVRVRGEHDVTGWSAESVVEAGLLHPDDWSAVAVGPSWPENPEENRRPALLRSTFVVPDIIVRARLYITAHGLYRAFVNGIRVGDDELTPGWTSYPTRLRYYTYDITTALQPGQNTIGALLGDGWYRGRLGFHGGHTNLYGTDTALLAQISIEHPDGTTTTLGTGPTWECIPAATLTSSLLEGETHDARLDQPGWASPGAETAGWSPVASRSIDLATLTGPDGPSVRCTEDISPVSTTRHVDGRIIVDFGQNLVGRIRLVISGSAGETITLRHAEVLDEAGNLYTRPLRGAYAEDRYTLRGEGLEVWEPAFTIHGFRYAELTGWGDRPVDGHIVARVLHTDMARAGWFGTSDPKLNRLHENIVWSTRGNFVDLPTDCPQRDERLGWTGDIQVFAPTAGYLYNSAGLLTSWLKDVAAEQLPDGTVPWYVPVIPGGEQWTPPRPGAGWGDAAVLVPWAIYQHTGDTAVLEQQFLSAKAWSDLQARLAGPDHVWDTSYQLGDWLDPSAPPEDPAHGLTDPNLVATAYYAHSARILAAYPRIPDSVISGELQARAHLAREGFRSRYRIGPGTLTSDSQAAYALAVVFDLFDPGELPIAGDHLARLVRAADTHLTTGFLGTPVLLDALTRTGHTTLAYELLRQDTVPSWLYPVTMGATTVWERWDSMLPDGTVNPGDMTSFNHFAFGAVADWMHRTIAGLTPAIPGWGHIHFRPGYESGLDWAQGAHFTPNGLTQIRWRRADEFILATITIPAGSTAVFEHPDGSTDRYEHGTFEISVPAPQ